MHFLLIFILPRSDGVNQMEGNVLSHNLFSKESNLNFYGVHLLILYHILLPCQSQVMSSIIPFILSGK